MKLKTLLIALLLSLAFVGAADAAVYRQYSGYSGGTYYGHPAGYGTQVTVTYDSSSSYLYAGYNSGYTYPSYGYYYNYPYYNYGYYPSYNYGYYPSYNYGYGGGYCQTSCYWVGGYRQCGCY